MDMTGAEETVTVAVDFFEVSAVAVTVTVYVPAVVGVQTTLPLFLTHPEPVVGLTDTVKSVFGVVITGIVVCSPIRIFTDGVMATFTYCGLGGFGLGGLLLSLFPPPQAAKNMEMIAVVINPALLQCVMILSCYAKNACFFIVPFQMSASTVFYEKTALAGIIQSVFFPLLCLRGQRERINPARIGDVVV